MSLRLLRSIGLAALLLAARPALATTMVALSEADLVRLSRVVAVVEVVSLQVKRAGPRLYTEATLRVARPVKGAKAGEELVVIVPGGELGEWAQRVEGAPRLTEGETSLVFLEPSDARRMRFVGLEQGRLTLVEDGAGPGGWTLVRDVTSRLVAPNGVMPLLPAREALAPVLERLSKLGGAR